MQIGTKSLALLSAAALAVIVAQAAPASAQTNLREPDAPSRDAATVWSGSSAPGTPSAPAASQSQERQLPGREGGDSRLMQRKGEPPVGGGNPQIK